MTISCKRSFSSLDRQVHCDASFIKPDRYRQIEHLAEDTAGRLIAQGAGISYTAMSFGDSSTVVGMTSFNRILEYDEAGQSLEVEAGISLGKIYEFLEPLGYYLSIQPGYPQITVGGCIACNIHGKNQFREGLFSNLVEEVTLFHPRHGLLELSRQKNTELFNLTCGGLGLTGIIIKAKLRIDPIPSRQIETMNIRVSSLTDTVRVLRELKDSHELLYSWNQICPSQGELGEGFVISGKFGAQVGDSDVDLKFKDLTPTQFRKIPKVYNRVSTALLNMAYLRFNTQIRPKATLSFSEFTFPVMNKTFYFDFFGRSGFVERQMLIPDGRIEAYLSEFSFLVRKYQPNIVLGTCKLFQGKQTFLNYCGSGISLSIDLPSHPSLNPFHAELDQLNVRSGAIDNLAKDSRVSRMVVEAEYPEFNLFKKKLQEFDPARQFVSAVSERIGL